MQTRVSALDLQRQKFIMESKLTKRRENETLSRLRDFQSKIRSKDVQGDEENWMNNRLKFHVDSQRAYDVDKAQQYQSKDGFGNFVTGGNENKKYANAYSDVKRPDLGGDVIQSVDLEELVSMQELIRLAKGEQQ